MAGNWGDQPSQRLPRELQARERAQAAWDPGWSFDEDVLSLHEQVAELVMSLRLATGMIGPSTSQRNAPLPLHALAMSQVDT